MNFPGETADEWVRSPSHWLGLFLGTTSASASACVDIYLTLTRICYTCRQLPSEIGNLIQLRILRAANNKLTSLPDSLCNLLDMETLELTNNCITELPLKLCNLTKIRYMHQYSHMIPVGLWLHKNPIVAPPEVRMSSIISLVPASHFEMVHVSWFSPWTHNSMHALRSTSSQTS